MKRAGGTVTKGTKGWPVLLYKRVSKSAASDQDDTGYFIVRQFTVFNVVAQTTGIELPTHTAREHVPTDAELIIEHSGAEFRRARILGPEQRGNPAPRPGGLLAGGSHWPAARAHSQHARLGSSIRCGSGERVRGCHA